MLNSKETPPPTPGRWRKGNPGLNKLIFPNSFPSQAQTCHEITLQKLQEAAVAFPEDGCAIAQTCCSETGPCCPHLTVMLTLGPQQGKAGAGFLYRKTYFKPFFSFFTCLAVTLPKRDRVRRGLEHHGLPTWLSVTHGAVPPQHLTSSRCTQPCATQTEKAAQCGQTHQAVPEKRPRAEVPQHDGAGRNAWGGWRAPPRRHFSARSRQSLEELHGWDGREDSQDGSFWSRSGSNF